MSIRRVQVLQIDDDPADAQLMHALLDSVPDAPFELVWADSLERGLERLAAGGVSAVLLDLSLPDGDELATLHRVLTAAPGVPIVVTARTDDEAQALRAVHAGAQDYLFKGQTDAHLLVRALRYAIERQWLLLSLDQARQREERERETAELRSLEALSTPGPTSVTAQMFGIAPLREALPGTFRELVQRYAELLDKSLEQRAYKVDHNVSEALRLLADQLGFLRAGPRDVVDIHTSALRQRMNDASPSRAHAYVEEGRLTVLELMGYMVLFYRSHSVGVWLPSGVRGE